MASLATLGRLSGRLASRKLAQDATRGFRTSTAALAAQNFTMPALSPTMTEGNISSWRVNEGEKFSAGDVLLEIETDKATMDVEAQEEGVLMKIFKGDGAKAVPVGARIAVVAEEGDDIASLEIPPDEQPSAGKKQEAAKPQQPTSSSSSSPPPERAESSEQQHQPATKSKKPSPKQTYPLLPSVAHLLKEKGVDESAIGEMTPTGPNGRLLKGDVLAYLGTINQSTPAAVSARFEKLSHLDLSNIKVVAPAKPAAAEPAKKEASGKAATPQPPQESLVVLPISLAAAARLQKKMDRSLGFNLPLSAFIERAADLANDDLPPAPREPTADELFDQVLGLPSGRRVSRGSYLPQVSPLATPSTVRAAAPAIDIIDVLSGKARPTPVRSAAASSITMEAPTGLLSFSLTVPKAEEKRAGVFLERVKLVLENEPGRLVL